MCIRDRDINTVLHDGDAVKVQVINIAPDGKIALSIKRLSLIHI